MKHLLILTVGICLLVSVPAIADQAEDEAAIREAVKQSFAAYNAHDAKAFVALRTEDYEDWVGATKGREARVKDLTETFERQKSIRAKQLEEIGIIFVTPDVAIYRRR